MANHQMKNKSPKQIKKTLKTAKLGLKAYHAGDFATALTKFMELLDHQPNDLTYLNIIADCLIRLGVRDKAIEVIEYCLHHNEPDADLVMVLGQVALDIAEYEIAIKLYRIGIGMEPENTLFYNNLATSLGNMRHFDEAIGLLQEVIPLFPKEASLWNTLAVQVQYRDSYKDAMVFFKQAVELDPKLSQAWNNMSIATNNIQDAIEYGRKSSEAKQDNPEPMIGLAHLLLDQGYLEEGWEKYDYRLSEFRKSAKKQTMVYTHQLPRWQGEDLSGKTILICAEQGIGDEMFFGGAVKEIADRAEKVYLCVNHRLIELFRRAYPTITVVGYSTAEVMGYLYRSVPKVEEAIKAGEISVDCYVPMASIPRYYWNDADRMPVYKGGYLHGKDDDVALWKERLNALPHKLNVGIAWRSGNMDASRTIQYAREDEFKPILSVEGVNFINMQYGDVDNEIKSFEEKLGCKIHTWDDFDIKANLEWNFALANNLDLIISPGITPGIIGMCAGTEVWKFAKRQCYIRLGAGDHVPVYPNCKIDIVDMYGDYSELFALYGKRLHEMALAAG